MDLTHRVFWLCLGLSVGCGGVSGGAPIHAADARRLIQRCEVRTVRFAPEAVYLGLRSGESVRYADDETESGRRALSDALTTLPEQCDPIETTVERVEHGGPDQGQY